VAPGWNGLRASIRLDIASVREVRRCLQSVGFFTEVVEASPLGKLPAERQLVAATILERQGKPIPASAADNIAALAARFAQADAGMWAASRAIAEGAEPDSKVEAAPAVEPEPKPVPKARPKLMVVRPEPVPAAAPTR
jgi:hypothetical protein